MIRLISSSVKGALLAARLEPTRLDVGADRRLEDPLPVDTEAEERSQGRQALALSPRAELPVRPESIDVARRELIEHHVAQPVRELPDLLRERVGKIAESGGFSPAALAIGDVRDAGRLERGPRLLSDRLGAAARNWAGGP